MLTQADIDITDRDIEETMQELYGGGVRNDEGEVFNEISLSCEACVENGYDECQGHLRLVSGEYI